MIDKAPIDATLNFDIDAFTGNARKAEQAMKDLELTGTRALYHASAFALSDVDDTRIVMPESSYIRGCGFEDGHVCLWVGVDETQPLIARTFRVVGTNESYLAPDGLSYIGSVFHPGEAFVYHIFEVL